MSSPSHNSRQASKPQAAQKRLCAKIRNICTLMDNVSKITTDRFAADGIKVLSRILSKTISELSLACCDEDQELEQDATGKAGSSDINNVGATLAASAQDTTANGIHHSEDRIEASDSSALKLASASSTQLLDTGDTKDGLEEGSPVVNCDSGVTLPALTITEVPPVANTTETTPFPYTAGEVLELKTPDGRRLLATITQVHPVSMSPVLVVQLDNWSGPQEAVLKLYDRRFGNHRKECQLSDDPPEPHTAQAEAAWQRYVRCGLAEPLLQVIQHENDDWRNYGDDSEDEVDDRPEWERLGEQEGRHHYELMNDYTTEVRAYKELQELQGRCIPTFFSAVVFDMQSAQSDLPATYFQVTGILIEKIDGFSLSDLLANTPKESPSLWKEIIEDTMECSAKANRLGVIHGDSAPRNVIISSLDGNGYKPFLVDFAMACFESDYKDDCISGTDEYFDNGGMCSCWSCSVYLNDDAAAVGGDMRGAVKRATGHTLNFCYPDDRFPAPRKIATPVVGLDH
ncbi:hypothetical protein GGR51DRAFT_556421 [Nemania sp. FL0031]|nr:hypothetical protein GGR51DRAFT_556421 [Nemania sp. FL0031]